MEGQFQRAMGPRAIIVLDVLPQNRPQMTLVSDDPEIQTPRQVIKPSLLVIGWLKPRARNLQIQVSDSDVILALYNLLNTG